MIQRYAQFWFFRWGSGNSFSTTFCVWFFNKIAPHVIFYCLTKFHCLVAFTSWDMEQYVIAILRQPGCDIINFKINLIFLIKSFLYITKKTRQKLKYLENEKSFYSEIKKNFHHFKRTFSCQKLSQTLECAFNARAMSRSLRKAAYSWSSIRKMSTKTWFLSKVTVVLLTTYLFVILLPRNCCYTLYSRSNG